MHSQFYVSYQAYVDRWLENLFICKRCDKNILKQIFVKPETVMTSLKVNECRLSLIHQYWRSHIEGVLNLLTRNCYTSEIKIGTQAKLVYLHHSQTWWCCNFAKENSIACPENWFIPDLIKPFCQNIIRIRNIKDKVILKGCISILEPFKKGG